MLIDGHGRVVDYLRVSITQRCNFRCKYCMPDRPFEWVSHEKILSFEEMFLFIKVAIDEGIKKIRVTGGEPLVRKDAHKFIKMISDYAANIDLSMTTNGYFLSNFAKNLKDAGLKRVNMSLDTLNPQKAVKLTGKDVLKKVLSGFEEALNVGLEVKLNCVVLKDFNDDELIDLLKFAKNHACEIRFIEYMENTHAKNSLKGLKKEEILKILSTEFSFFESPKKPNSPASLFTVENSSNDGSEYKFGIIAPHKHDFCDSCNRIRLSADGLLIPCLYYEDALSIKKALRSGDLLKASEILREVLKNKPEKNRWENSKSEISNRAFYQTGG